MADEFRPRAREAYVSSMELTGAITTVLLSPLEDGEVAGDHGRPCLALLGRVRRWLRGRRVCVDPSL